MEISIDEALEILKNSKFKLDETNKTEWVKALKSDKYEQGTGFLCYKGKYCCLGVCCDINQYDRFEKDSGHIEFYSNSGSDYSTYFIPGNVIPENIQEALATLNDNGYTFEQIADVIDTHL